MCNTLRTLGYSPRDVHIVAESGRKTRLDAHQRMEDRMAGRGAHYAQRSSYIGDIPRVTLSLSDLSTLTIRKSGVTLRRVPDQPSQEGGPGALRDSPTQGKPPSLSPG